MTRATTCHSLPTGERPGGGFWFRHFHTRRALLSFAKRHGITVMWW